LTHEILELIIAAVLIPTTIMIASFQSNVRLYSSLRESPLEDRYTDSFAWRSTLWTLVRGPESLAGRHGTAETGNPWRVD